MKTPKLTVLALACAAAMPAFAQNTSNSWCGATNLDRTRNVFTIVNPTATTNQQCFISVVSKADWRGGMPDLASSEIVEGNYQVTLSGGGGAGGGGAERVGGGGGGAGAVPFVTTRYLAPGIYRMTIGAGGIAGSKYTNGGDGAPTSLSDAYSGSVVAGFSGAEYWAGGYPQSYSVARRDNGQLSGFADAPGEPAGGGGVAVGGQSEGGDGGRITTGRRAEDGGRLMTAGYQGAPGKAGTDYTGPRMRVEVAGGGGGGAGFGNGGDGAIATPADIVAKTARHGELGAGGGGGAGGQNVAGAGGNGGNGFIQLAYADAVPPAGANYVAQTAPVQYVAPRTSTAPSSSQSMDAAGTAPMDSRPARRDRN